MSSFNFEIKRQSYSIALSKTQEALKAGDTASGVEYLSRALELCSQLAEHCIIAPVKEQYQSEYRKLTALGDSLSKGVNPFCGSAANTGNSPLNGAYSGGNSVNLPTKAPSASAKREPSVSAPSTPKTGVKPEGAAKTVANASYCKFFSGEVPSTKLVDVAGLGDVKKEIRLRVIEPMKDPALYSAYNDDAGCRILMYGPPGCGKSFVAEAIAGELGCAYAILNAADLLDKYVGEGSKRVMQIFKEAEKFDNCLIFFDELDAVFASREGDDSRYTKDILTTFLTCLSGFKSGEKGGVKVIVGATNRPWALDSALIRGKRFDTHIYVGLPDNEARAFLINKAFKKNPSLIEKSDLTAEWLTEAFGGYSCADISAMLGKMKSRAYERALDNREKGIEAFEPVLKADAEAVLADYRNSVTKESLEAFQAFKNGEI